jgi:hypothetical protein
MCLHSKVQELVAQRLDLRTLDRLGTPRSIVVHPLEPAGIGDGSAGLPRVQDLHANTPEPVRTEVLHS